jgi:hypothetical protein
MLQLATLSELMALWMSGVFVVLGCLSICGENLCGGLSPEGRGPSALDFVPPLVNLLKTTV